MMTLSVCSGTWSDAVTAACGEIPNVEDPGTIAMEKAVRAALRELDITVKVEVQAEIPTV